MYESLIALTPPAPVSALDLATAKAHCRVDASDTTEDLNLTLYIQAARNSASSYVKQTLWPTSYMLTRDTLPSLGINGPTGSAGFNSFLNSTVYPYTLDAVFRVLNPPLISIDSITYTDTNGNPATLDPSFYRFVPGFPGRVAPAYGKIWPFTLPQIGSVQINYTCGYGTTTTTVTLAGGVTTSTAVMTSFGLPAPITQTTTAATVAGDVAGTTTVVNVPFNIQAGILLWVGTLFRNRESVVTGITSVMPHGVKELFDTANKGYYR
jgi:hypothetical protein